MTSSDNSDSGGSSTRAWTYDAAGRLIFTSEVRNGVTTTLATGYDGNGKVIHEIMNGATGDYLIHSSVLGTVLTKLNVNGGKDITYVPTNRLLAPMQMQDQPGSFPASYMTWVSRDPLGIQENGKAYDPFGSLVANVQPPMGGPPSYIPVFGATYAGVTSNSFINANNFSGGCLLDGRPADCNSVKFQLANNPFAQLDPNHSLPLTESGANQTPQLPSGVREEWRLVQPGQRAPAGAKTRTAYSGEFVWYAHYSSFGGENFFPDPQNTLSLPSDLHDRVKAIVNSPKGDCANYIKKLLGEVASNYGEAFSDDPSDLFNRVEREAGFRLKKIKYAGLTDFRGNRRVIYIKPMTLSGKEDARVLEHTKNGYAVTALNELMHHARKSGIYTDRMLAEAAFSLLTPWGRFGRPLPKSAHDVEANSTYFHPFLNQHCPSVTGE